VGLAFPSSPSGPGFEEWRRDFEDLEGALSTLSRMKEPMVSDYQKFCAFLPPQLKRERPGREMARLVDEFFVAIATVRSKLADVDKLTLMRSKYSSDRVHLGRLEVLAGMALLVGVILPLSLLARRRRLSRFVTALVTLIFLMAAFWQLRRDVAGTRISSDVDAYLRARWYGTLAQELEARPKRAF